jgi:phage-related protein
VRRVLKFYRATDGQCPVAEFLDSLPGKWARKITWVLKLIEEMDIVPSRYFKKLTDTEDIWECRIQFGSNIMRIFCFFTGDEVVVLTHGIMKKTNKLPKKEIDRAENYRRDYLSRSSR